MTTMKGNQPPRLKKTTLLIAPRFFGYDRAIADELEAQGAVVDRIYDRPFDSPHMAAITRFAPEMVARFAAPLYRRQIADYGRSHYDLILIVNGQTLATELLAELRVTFPSAYIVLYLWDSIDNRRSVRSNLSLVDHCLSFDPHDALKYQMMLRPLFFTRQFYEPSLLAQDIDISFVGTAHTDRAAVVKRVNAALANDVQRYWFLFLQARWVFYSRKFFDRRMKTCRMSDFTFEPMPSEALRNIFWRSRSILDIEHPRQRGLTMRTFETVGAGRKLITTNANIRDYDFYDPRNILVIDRACPTNLETSFFKEEYHPLPDEQYHYYSISGWLASVAHG